MYVEIFDCYLHVQGGVVIIPSRMIKIEGYKEMLHQFSRNELAIGTEGLEKLKNTKEQAVLRNL